MSDGDDGIPGDGRSRPLSPRSLKSPLKGEVAKLRGVLAASVFLPISYFFLTPSCGANRASNDIRIPHARAAQLKEQETQIQQLNTQLASSDEEKVRFASLAPRRRPKAIAARSIVRHDSTCTSFALCVR